MAGASSINPTTEAKDARSTADGQTSPTCERGRLGWTADETYCAWSE